MNNQQKEILLFIFAGIFFFLLFYPYYKWLTVSWKSNPSDSFGYLAPFVSGWMVFLKNNKIKSAPVSYYKGGWVFFISGVCLPLYSRWSSQIIIACLSLPLCLYGLSLIIWGKDRCRYLLLPIFFLIFLYPWGDILNIAVGFQLRRLSVLMAYYLYKCLGMDAAVSGTLLFTGRFLVDIAPACSGINTMNTLLFIGAVGAFLNDGVLKNKILLFVSAVPLAIILNTIRVVITGLIGHIYGEDAAMGYYHNLSGILLFGLAMLLLYVESQCLKGKKTSIKRLDYKVPS